MEMHSQSGDYPGQNTRHETQLDRIIFFSDAVFAIAITLLIIDIRIPLHESFTSGQLLSAIGDKAPELFGFIISFFIIAAFWKHHHSIFGYVIKYDQALIWLNLFFLFFIVLLPFSTSVFSLYGNLLTATSLYTLNTLLAGMMNFLCLKHIANPEKKLSAGLYSSDELRMIYVHILAIPVWMLICWIVGLITQPAIGDLCLFGLGFVMPLSNKLFGKKSSRGKKEE